MIEKLKHRKATEQDLNDIVTMLHDDVLGQMREAQSPEMVDSYMQAFEQITRDPNHYLMVVTLDSVIVGSCHLMLLPSLTFRGSKRLEIEAVRVSKNHRGQGVGAWMIKEAINYGEKHGASIIQLTTNKQRPDAKRFYEKLGFENTHEGLKLFLEAKK